MFVINTNSSLSIVDHPSFQKMIGYCNETAQVISRRTLGHEIQELYTSLFSRVKQQL